MTDHTNTGITFDTINIEEGHIEVGPMLFDHQGFTRSNGSIAARVYERLTKASRRRQAIYSAGDYSLRGNDPLTEHAYRQGLYDALKALQVELEE